MLTIPRDHCTVHQLQGLLGEIFRARDELYAASSSLSEEDASHICRRLGDQMGGCAADLQQIITASGTRPVGPRRERSGRSSSVPVACRSGDRLVVDAAERIAKIITEQYAAMMRQLADQEVADLLVRQCEQFQFANCVLRTMAKTNR